MSDTENKRDWLNTVAACALAEADGKTIEWQDSKGEWRAKGLHSYLGHFTYRVKPEPKYRPYNSKELEALVGKTIRNRSSRVVRQVVGFDNSYVHTHVNTYTADALLTHWQFMDGTPCGVLES